MRTCWTAGCRAISGCGLTGCEGCTVWAHLHPLAHQPDHQPCSGPQYCPVCVGQSGALCWLLLHVAHAEVHTYHHDLHLQTSGEVISLGNRYSSQKRAHLRPHLSSDLRRCYADYAKVLVCCQKSQPWSTSLPFFLPYKRQNMQDKSSNTCFYSAKQRIIPFSHCRGTKPLPGEVSPRCRIEGLLATRRDKAGEGVSSQISRLSLCELHGALGKCSPGK